MLTAYLVSPSIVTKKVVFGQKRDGEVGTALLAVDRTLKVSVFLRKMSLFKRKKTTTTLIA